MTYDTESTPGPRKPLIFISCGQYTPDEIALGQGIERRVLKDGRYAAYFAEQQNTLDGLFSNILSALGRCSAFVGVMHHRGVVRTPHGERIRGSVWVEQETAIAAFVQHVLGRKIEVALYLQTGIYREGIREQLRLSPIEFNSSDEVLTDFRNRLKHWNLTVGENDPEHVRRKRIREALAGLDQEGAELDRTSRATRDMPEVDLLKKRVDIWALKVEAYLREALDESYVVRWRADPSPSYTVTGTFSPWQRRLVNYLTYRRGRLHEFMAELS